MMGGDIVLTQHFEGTLTHVADASLALQVASSLVLGVSCLLALAVLLPLALWLWNQSYVAALRSRSSTSTRSVQKSDPAYIPPRELWRLTELRDFTRGDDGPILLAVDGLVFNVAASRRFYGPGGEYAVMAGQDATRLLAKNRVEPETAEEAATELTIAERAALGAWLVLFKTKYDVVGRLATAKEAAALDARQERREAYLDSLEQMDTVEGAATREPAAQSRTAVARRQLEAAWVADSATGTPDDLI